MNQVRSKFTIASACLFATLAMLVAPAALAQATTDTWLGNTTPNLADPNWNSGNNPPLNGDTWLFGPAGTAGAALNNTFASITVSNITFLSGAGAYVFTGNALTLTNSITNASTSLQTFDLPITISKNSTISLTGGGGDVNMGGFVSGTGNLNLAGTGTLTWTNVNSGYSGSITNGVNDTLVLTNGAAIGTYAAPTYTWNTSAVFTNNGVLVYSSSATNAFGPKTDGIGSYIINGPGEFLSSTANSWGVSGNITVNGGLYSNPKRNSFQHQKRIR